MIKAADWRRSLCAGMEAGPGGDQRDTRTEALAYVPLIMTISLVSANDFIGCRIYGRAGRNQRYRILIKH